MKRKTLANINSAINNTHFQEDFIDIKLHCKKYFHKKKRL